MQKQFFNTTFLSFYKLPAWIIAFFLIDQFSKVKGMTYNNTEQAYNTSDGSLGFIEFNPLFFAPEKILGCLEQNCGLNPITLPEDFNWYFYQSICTLSYKFSNSTLNYAQAAWSLASYNSTLAMQKVDCVWSCFSPIPSDCPDHLPASSNWINALIIIGSVTALGIAVGVGLYAWARYANWAEKSSAKEIDEPHEMQNISKVLRSYGTV